MVDNRFRSHRPPAGGGIALFVVAAIALVVIALAIFDSRSAGRLFEAEPSEAGQSNADSAGQG